MANQLGQLARRVFGTSTRTFLTTSNVFKNTTTPFSPFGLTVVKYKKKRIGLGKKGGGGVVTERELRVEKVQNYLATL